MKGFKLAAAAGAVAIGLGAAGAATANQVTFNLTGTVTTVCGVFADGANTVNVGFGDLGTALVTDWITTGPQNIHYVCNGPTGFSRNVHSTNGGVLLNDQNTGETVDYEMFHSANPNDSVPDSIGFGYTQLGTDIDDNFNASDFLNQVSETVVFRARGVVQADGTLAVSSANYRDTVVVTVTAM